MSGEHTHPEVTALDTALANLTARVGVLTAQVVALEAGQALLATKTAALEEGLRAMATWHDYSGKPDTTQVVKAGDYVRVDVDVADPPRSGTLELHMLYVNCSLSWKSGEDAGSIRVKYVREDNDDSGYQDFHVVRAAAIGSPGSFLITANHWEVGQAGLGGRWWIRVGGGLASVTLGTRYVKIAQVG